MPNTAVWRWRCFSLVFFTIVAAFSLRPASILTSIGRTLTPLFLLFFGVLAVTVLARPAASLPPEPFGELPLRPPSSPGFLEGYNTMDALAGLAFGIVVVNVIRGAGVTRPEAVAISTVRSGLFSCLIMAGIYIVVTLMGVQSRAIRRTPPTAARCCRSWPTAITARPAR